MDIQIAIVTSAGNGTGRAIAIRLAKLSCGVASADIKEDLNETVRLIKEESRASFPIIADVSVQNALKKSNL